jgi:hypothetical protein
MASNPQYTEVMRTATDPEGNGGNPHVGPPVRLPFRLPLPVPHVLPCLLCLSPEDQENKTVRSHLNDDNVQAGLANCAHEVRGANRPSRARRDRPHVPVLHLLACCFSQLSPNCHLVKSPRHSFYSPIPPPNQTFHSICLLLLSLCQP